MSSTATPTTTPTRTRRIFMNGTQRMEDPNVSLSLDQVKKIHAATAPDLNNAALTLKETRPDGTQVYHYERSVGRKG